MRHLKRLIKEGPARFETRIRRKDGQIVDVEGKKSIVRIDGKGYFFSFFRDINEKRQAYRVLLKRERDLEIEATNLDEVNTALRVLLKKREEDKTELEQKVLSNVKQLMSVVDGTAPCRILLSTQDPKSGYPRCPFSEPVVPREIRQELSRPFAWLVGQVTKSEGFRSQPRTV